ncbi:MAG: hypothetical protein JO326_10100 [Acetobacteraceae bacterium]|nr:hypothetical protein [Acetobacteraceae bacterium]
MSVRSVITERCNAAAAPSASQACENSAAWVAAMRAGDIAAAFALSDAVLRSRHPSDADNPRLPYHLRWVWDGTPCDGRDVLVRCYHGLGDTIQFSRFLPALAARARTVHVEAQPTLLPLLSAIPGVARWIAFREDAPAPPRQVNLEIMELAHALRLGPEDIAAPKLPVAGLRLAPSPVWGVCWRAGDWDPQRSVPAASLLAALRQSGTRFVSLQRGPGADEAGDAFLNPGDRSADVLRTASLLRGVDAVATVDTMVAHLAGALGCRTALLLKAEADWRWMGERTDSVWYPSLRLFRQRTPGDWSAPLAALRAWAAG